MELFVFLLILYIVYYLFFRKKVPINSRTNKKPSPLSIIKHGHRCYAEGLNDSEKIVVDLLSHGLSHKDYFIFNNLIIPSSTSESTQIDHIVVSRFGIFVIETKGYGGWVFSHKNRDKWSVTYPGGEKHSFFNPLWQNYGHLMALKSALPFIQDNFHEIVVFTDSCEFKTPQIDKVIYVHELINYIKDFNQPQINEQRLLMAIGKLSYMCQAVDITPAEHVSTIRQMLQRKEIEKTELSRA